MNKPHPDRRQPPGPVTVQLTGAHETERPRARLREPPQRSLFALQFAGEGQRLDRGAAIEAPVEGLLGRNAVSEPAPSQRTGPVVDLAMIDIKRR